MQLYAIDRLGEYVNAGWALAGEDYFCPECGDLLRVRGGLRVQRHFFHYRGKFFCRQRGKGAEHLNVQQRIVSELPLGEGRMEKRFPEIGRVADVAWEARKIVFEVQCAVMTAEEARRRTSDYRELGWSVVWILHDERYNQEVEAPLEEALVEVPHYYTNINAEGFGTIYDQIALRDGGLRKVLLPRLEVGIAAREVGRVLEFPGLLSARVEGWGLHLPGDYVDLWKEDRMNPLWYEVRDLEARERWSWRRRLAGRFFEVFVRRPYRLALQWMLEGACWRG